MKKILCSLLLFLTLSHSVFANEFATDVHIRGGIQQSLLVDCRYALYQKPDAVIFFNARGGLGSTYRTYTPHTHDAFIEGNIGLGYRTPQRNGTLGIYSYYGKLKTPYHNYFSRATLGVEYFNENYGMYLNLYGPAGKRSRTINRRYGFNKFRFNFIGNTLHFKNLGKREAMSHLAMELGVQKKFGRIHARANGYFHAATSQVRKRAGGMLELNYPLSASALFTAIGGYDTYYKSQAQLGFIYLFGETNTTESCTEQKLQPVYLEEFFWAQRGKKVLNDTVVQSDIIFVDSSRMYFDGFQGDGTFENPYLNASLANNAITTIPDATVYFYQGVGPYQNFGTFDLIGSQTLTGQGGNYMVQNVVVLPGSPATRPILARNATQEMLNTPLITVTNGGSNTIENIGLTNGSGAVATGGSLITNVGSSINSLTINNLTATDKVTLFFTADSQTVKLFDNDIYGVDIKTFNSASLNIQVENNTFRTNKMIAQRFFQPIGASLFLESLNNSTYVVSNIQNNKCFNTTLNANRHLGFGYLSSGNSTNVTPNGFISNASFGALPAASAGAFLFQGVDTSRVKIEGCFDNFSATDEFTLQRCDVNIKKVGVPGSAAGMSQANNNTVVVPFAAVNIFNAP